MTQHKQLTKNLIKLNQIIESLNQSVDVRQVLDFALTRLVDLMGLETGWVFLKDPDAQNRWAGKGFVLAAHHNLPPALGLRRARAWKGDCECQTMCQKGELVAGYNHVQCSRLRNAPGDRHNLTVHASAPLRSGNNLLGILNVAGPDWDMFSEESLILLANVGSQIGIALERARLYDLLQEQRIHEQAVLLDLSNKLLSHTNLENLLNYLVEELPYLMEVDACAILLPGNNKNHLDFVAAYGWHNNPVVAQRRVPADKSSGSGLAMQQQKAVIVEDFEINDPTPWTAQWLHEEQFIGHAVVPLVVEGRSIGSLMIDKRQEPLSLTEGELNYLRLMANQAAIAIENARLHQEEIKRQRLEDELSVGQQIQMSLLPASVPEAEGWDFAATYRPAWQVGGDFYDFFELAGDPHQLGLVIADVAGKGVPAALFMALSRSLIRTKSMSGRAPAGVLTRANRLIYKDSRSNLFVTAFYATLDLRTGWLAYTSAGHNWPLWQHAKTGTIKTLSAKGTIMGAFEQIELEDHEITMAPGDLIVFYTDGITEATNATSNMFGEERLHTAISAKPNANAQQILDNILNAVDNFVGNIPQADDMTLFVIKRQAKLNSLKPITQKT